MIKKCISKGWKFADFPSYGKPYIDVDLPHDYSISKPRDKNGDEYNAYFRTTSGVYVKYLNFEKDRHYILDIDGAFSCTEVTFNQELLMLHPHGYTPILVDLTDNVIDGIDNKLVITTNPLQFATRWYTGCGIYRDVFMWEGGAVRIEPWDLFVSTKNVTDKSADVVIKYTVSADYDCDTKVKFAITDKNGKVLVISESTVKAVKGEKVENETVIKLSKPELWSVDTPVLYSLSAEVVVNGETLDIATADFGIKTISVDAKNGLLFNGKPMKLRGGCIHHDHGVLGAMAFPVAEERKIRRLKEAGFNAVRIAHNPPSLALLEVCDRIGMIVMDEAFDVWSKRKLTVTSDYHIFFKEWWDRDISYMVKRDRNHPCVLSYSIGNEIHEIDGTSGAAEWSRKLSDEIRKYDDTKIVTAAIQKVSIAKFHPEKIDPDSYKNYMLDRTGHGDEHVINKITKPFEDPLDIVGLNYHHDLYEGFHEDYPDKVIWGSENYTVGFHDYWNDVLAHSYNIGDFTWTAIDNLGEVGWGASVWNREVDKLYDRSYPWRTCYQGDLDLTAERRPQSYYREAVWFGGKELKIFVTHPEHFGEEHYGTGWHWADVHESWTFDDKYVNRPVKVETYIQADKVEWFVNGNKVGESVPEKSIATLNTVYVKGEITAVAIKDGKEFAKCTLKTAGEKAGVNVVPEKAEILADRRDLAYFDISVVDSNGILMAEDESELVAHVVGGELMGIFSANPRCEDEYTTNVCHAFKGKALAIVRTANPGTVKINVLSKDLASGYAEVKAK